MREWPSTPVPKHGRAVFLDRDGTINVDTHFPHKVEDLEVVSGGLEGLKLLSSLSLEIIVISNQAGIALGIFTEDDMRRFNEAIRGLVFECGGRIDAFYYCPDLEPKHLPPGAPLSKCSKPAPGMLLEASDDFLLDLSRCFVIGDTTADVAAGNEVGCVTILLNTGKAGKEEGALPVEPDHRAETLYEAALLVRRYLDEEIKSPA